MSEVPYLNPKPYLHELINKKIAVRLKWGIEYHGKLVSFDDYMNIQLLDSEEVMNNSTKGKVGEILIRCNNILFIREVPSEE